jgi:ribose/xylose/arabinose/galactoside ABC-type transport system permease subunit/ABC-type sugar transport system substrate-binding protein
VSESARARPSALSRWCPNNEWVLLVVLALEVAIFGVTGDHFLTWGNGFEVVRLCAEIGVLAFGLTPVIKTGGIDLSVGSMMGLAAVTFGGLWAHGLPIALALAATLAVGAAGGALHGWLITRLRVPPLIVTLGTFSLYRGLAEAMTGGYMSYTGFPEPFLALGQGYLGGLVPTQLPVLIGVFIALWLLLHRSVMGRGVTAVGFNAAGARFAGVPVRTILVQVYVACGLCAALAGIIFVAHIGEAKADAGLGYELLAIAAVVLGGTSIAGGRGTLHGTLLGLLCLVVLQDGLRLSGQPSEIAGLAAGLILLTAIILNQSWVRAQRTAQVAGLRVVPPAPGTFSMKNSQIAVLVLAILAGAALIAGTNVYLMHSLASGGGGPGSGPPAAHRLVVAMTPKAKTDPYFVSCKEGADEAAAQLGVDILWDGPQDPDPAKQNEIVDSWITKGVDVIAASVNSPESIASVLRKAQERGIKVITWDADAPPDSRSFFVNQATAQGIGATLADEGARLAGGSGDYAIITASLTDSNQNEWIKYIKERMASAHPGMNLATVHPCDGQQDKALTETKNIVRAYPSVKAILAICSPALPGAAEALKQEGQHQVKLTGLSTPNLCRSYVHEGWIQSVILWNTKNLGYLTVYTAKAVHDGSLKAGDTHLDAGRLGALTVAGDQVLLGQPFIFDDKNIDGFRF